MKSKLSNVFVFVSFVAFAPLSSFGQVGATLNQPDSVPGEIVVKLKPTAAFNIESNLKNSLQSTLQGISILSVAAFQTDSSLQLVKIAKDTQLNKAIRALTQNPMVEYAEPNYFYTIQTVNPGVLALPDDPDFNKLWGMQNSGQTDTAGQVGTAGADINVVPAWEAGFTGSKNIVVAIIDTGMDWTHPDLKGNLYTNTAEIEDNGIDDDGNGFIDDIHGWNFFDKSKNSNDDNNHGSHCAGTIGGTGNNSLGVAGVNWNVSILPIKFLNKDGSGTLQAAVESINYARKMKVNLMSNSWGGGKFTQSLYDAIKGARDDGILFVAAAANDAVNNDGAAPGYPASYKLENIISVAATDNKDKKAVFSNYGKTSVHVAAPGVKIYSTVKDGKYATYSGTSMATPHVSGIAALMLSLDPHLTYDQIKDRLIKTSTPVAALKDLVVANGRVNVWNAINNIVP